MIQCSEIQYTLNLLSFNVIPMLILEDSMQIQCMKIQCESKRDKKCFESKKIDSMYTESQKIQCESKRVYALNLKRFNVRESMHSI
jgi:hypothetical protein